MKTDVELEEVLAAQIEALKRITDPVDRVDCLAQMIGTCAKLSRRAVYKIALDNDLAQHKQP